MNPESVVIVNISRNSKRKRYDEMITIGSLFAGIGGLELGLEWTGGFKTIWQVENNEYAIKVLKKHWPDAKRWNDVQTFLPEYGDWTCDLICGGFPCQPVSCAGRQKGESDSRWLWPEFKRIISILRPKYILAENVPGLYRYGLSNILFDLATLGYDAEWHSISAAAVGAPHLRERIFILAYTNSKSLGWSTKPRKKCNQWSIEPNVGRVAHGIPSRMDRLRCLGNAVVPQVTQFIGQKILEATK